MRLVGSVSDASSSTLGWAIVDNVRSASRHTVDGLVRGRWARRMVQSANRVAVRELQRLRTATLRKSMCPITDQLTHDTESDASGGDAGSLRKRCRVGQSQRPPSDVERLTECPRSGRAVGCPRAAARADQPERRRRVGTRTSSPPTRESRRREPTRFAVHPPARARSSEATA